MSYVVRSDYLDSEVRTENRNGTITVQDSLECTFETDAANPSLIYAVLHGERIPLVVSTGANNELRISLRGYTYPVTVLSGRDQYFQQLLKATATANSSTIRVPAPMPGLIKQVYVQNGQKVQRGDRLFILEAMKMENDIKAPAEGVINGVTITAGAAVEKNFNLCTIEPVPNND
jgi:biotin carboxyl carrier protein